MIDGAIQEFALTPDEFLDTRISGIRQRRSLRPRGRHERSFQLCRAESAVPAQFRPPRGRDGFKGIGDAANTQPGIDDRQK